MMIETWCPKNINVYMIQTAREPDIDKVMESLRKIAKNETKKNYNHQQV